MTPRSYYLSSQLNKLSYDFAQWLLKLFFNVWIFRVRSNNWPSTQPYAVTFGWGKLVIYCTWNYDKMVGGIPQGAQVIIHTELHATQNWCLNIKSHTEFHFVHNGMEFLTLQVWHNYLKSCEIFLNWTLKKNIEERQMNLKASRYRNTNLCENVPWTAGFFIGKIHSQATKSHTTGRASLDVLNVYPLQGYASF